MLQPIAIDSSDFPEIRRKGCVYVDKTAYFHQLATGPNARFFLARPRRFGKSLMISTLKALFEGRRELFEGLAISQTDWTWEKWPVLYFNFGFAAAYTATEFERTFPGTVEAAITQIGGKYLPEKSAAENFGRSIDALSARNGDRGVVILIDEYDDPVAQLLSKPEEAERVREMLADFFRQMKDRAGKIRFLMVTGVSKFTKMSVFSTLSNLVDLSFRKETAAMLGFTEKELEVYFEEHIRAHANVMGISNQAYRKDLKRWFNGYRFSRISPVSVYNPVSVGVNFSIREPSIQSSWSSTGKASMLMNFLKREELLTVDMEQVHGLQENDFDVTDIRNLRAVPMLYQTGYLTIDCYDPLTRTYSLRVPDEEVRQDLATVMTAVAAKQDTFWVSSLGYKLLHADWGAFFTGLKALYAGLPYGPKEGNVQEYSYERSLLLLLKSQGILCHAEVNQANGQADIVAEHPCGIFLFELKVGDSAEVALEQIRSKHYDAPYRGDSRPLWYLGLSFDRNTHLLLDAKAVKA